MLKRETRPMLEAFLIRAVAAVGIPERFRRIAGYIGLALACITLLWLAKSLYDRSLIAEHDAKQETAVIKADAVADDVAGQVAASEQAKVEKENDNARKAANAGDDPLADGLRSLRNRTPRNPKATD
jgi:hypothetical protein